MKFSLIFTSIVALLTSVHSQESQQQVNVNLIYADGGKLLSDSGMTTALSFTASDYSERLGDITNFPNLGGGPNVGSSPICVAITYPTDGQVINVLFINNAAKSEISPQAMSSLVGNGINDTFILADLIEVVPAQCQYP